MDSTSELPHLPHLAAWAALDSDPAATARLHAEPPHPYRTPFQRDRDRIIHSAAFRRLSGKTQVFMGEPGDYHRTRLTHTLEVACLARTIARALKLNEDLTEALALLHDLGHPPFGHAGEETLDACLAEFGGFCHNAQALVIVEQLEQRYPHFPGLNLTQAVRRAQQARVEKRLHAAGVPLEAQVVDAADSVAYDTHDTDDALELGLIRLEELLELSLWQEAARRVRRRFAALAGRDLERAIVHELINWLVGDLLATTRRGLAWPGDGAAAPHQIAIGPSSEVAQRKEQFEAFLHDHVYRNPQVLAQRQRAKARLLEMVELLRTAPGQLPKFFQVRAEQVGLLKSVGDFVASLTDRAAMELYRRAG
jgi:dGTPase